MSRLLTEDPIRSDGGHAPPNSLVQLTGTVVSDKPNAAGKITIDWEGSPPKTKSYGESVQLMLPNKRVVQVSLHPNLIREETRSASWSEIEHEDFAREFAADAPGPHVKIKITEQLVRPGQSIALIGVVDKYRFSGESPSMREGAAQEIASVMAQLIAVGEGAEERLLEEVDARRRRDAAEKTRAKQIEALGAWISRVIEAMKNPASFFAENILQIMWGAVALVGVYSLSTALSQELLPRMIRLSWGLFFINLSVFGWYMSTALLPRFVEDGNEIKVFEGMDFFKYLPKTHKDTPLRSLAQLKQTYGFDKIPKHSANIELVGTIIALCFLLGTPTMLILVATFGSMMVTIFDHIALATFSVGIFSLACLLWVGPLDHERIKFSRLMIKAPLAKVDGSWGYIEGSPKNVFQNKFFIADPSGEGESTIFFQGALWASPQRTLEMDLYNYLHLASHRQVMIVGRIEPSETTRRGAESLFIYASEGPARADLARRFKSLSIAAGIFIATMIVSLTLFSWYVPK